MYDQSFNLTTLLRVLRKSDFHSHADLYKDDFKKALINFALEAANTNFGNKNPLKSFDLKGKKVYQFKNLSDELVVRKICANLKHLVRNSQQSREFIVANLSQLISEAVPYRLYRLDIKNFYESFSTDAVIKKINGISKLGPSSKNLIAALLSSYVTSAGQGVPRGLALSALLSDLMMMDFDAKLAACPGVYFSARYVDDIIVVTNADEVEQSFIKLIKNLLPEGLILHETKRSILTVAQRVNPNQARPKLIEFDYLGYRFIVLEPKKDSKLRPNQQFREVLIDIAEKKISRFKTRINRAFLAFTKDKDFSLLLLRLKYLTANFSVQDINKNSPKLAGIYHSYPQLTSYTGNGLERLDKFLKCAVLATRGRVFEKSSKLLDASKKRELLKTSFTRGHEKRIFLHFPPKTINLIQECWIHE